MKTVYQQTSQNQYERPDPKEKPDSGDDIPDFDPGDLEAMEEISPDEEE